MAVELDWVFKPGNNLWNFSYVRWIYAYILVFFKIGTIALHWFYNILVFQELQLQWKVVQSILNTNRYTRDYMFSCFLQLTKAIIGNNRCQIWQLRIKIIIVSIKIWASVPLVRKQFKSNCNNCEIIFCLPPVCFD